MKLRLVLLTPSFDCGGFSVVPRSGRMSRVYVTPVVYYIDVTTKWVIYSIVGTKRVEEKKILEVLVWVRFTLHNFSLSRNYSYLLIIFLSQRKLT